jgi:hypothetical protein
MSLEPAPAFLVERFLPSVSAADVAAATQRLREHQGSAVRHLFTVLVTGEETGLSCFAASDRVSVARTNDDAAFPFDRIVEVTVFGVYRYS